MALWVMQETGYQSKNVKESSLNLCFCFILFVFFYINLRQYILHANYVLIIKGNNINIIHLEVLGLILSRIIVSVNRGDN